MTDQHARFSPPSAGLIVFQSLLHLPTPCTTMPSQSLTSAELAAWPDTRQPTIYGICALMLLLGNTSVPLRLWAQWKVHKQTFMEDYFLIAALVS